jgi:hypothetical protein
MMSVFVSHEMSHKNVSKMSIEVKKGCRKWVYNNVVTIPFFVCMCNSCIYNCYEVNLLVTVLQVGYLKESYEQPTITC